MKNLLLALLLILMPWKGFSQTITPQAANQVNVTNGSGGYALHPLAEYWIATQTVTSGTSITFSGIPQTYTSLKLVGTFNVTSGANLALQFNGDSTAAHYAYGFFYQYNGSAGFAQSNSATYILVGAASGAADIVIEDYSASTGGTPVTGNFSEMVIGSTTLSGNAGGLWTGNGITSIKIFDDGGATFAAGTFTLYGLK
jgi:hypothetical protein